MRAVPPYLGIKDRKKRENCPNEAMPEIYDRGWGNSKIAPQEPFRK